MIFTKEKYCLKKTLPYIHFFPDINIRKLISKMIFTKEKYCLKKALPYIHFFPDINIRPKMKSYCPHLPIALGSFVLKKKV